MVDIIKKDKKEPLLACWIAIVWEPFRGNKNMLKKALEDIKNLGFNTFIVDTHFEDLFDRYEEKETSQYVSMLEYVMETGEKIGLNFTSFSHWIFGANWYYMGVVEFPARIGESIIHPPHVKKPQCEKMYKMWSDITQNVMVENHEGLIKTYGKYFPKVLHKGKKIPFIFSWTDVTVRPSFDEEGIKRYQKWIESRYKHIEELNRVYGLNYNSFSGVSPEDYWAGYTELDKETYYADSEIHPVGGDYTVWCPKEKDFKDNPILIKKWVDNQLWRRDELTLYFKNMQVKHTKRGDDFYLIPSMQQWKIFFNDAKMRCWWSTTRAMDPWSISEYVKEVTFLTVPIDCYSRPDAYVVSAERSICRSINKWEQSLGGIYLGRYMFEDIYAYVSPCEIVGTMLANGTNSLYCYGYNGLDDGGTLYKLDWRIRTSVKTGFDWFKKCAPLIHGKNRRKDIVILFPLALSLIEPITEGTEFPDHRMDTLGWYKMLVDMHYMVDFIHPDQIKHGYLKDFFALVIPHNSCYQYMSDPEMEQIIADWVKKGGIVLHGPFCQSLPAEFRPEESLHKQEFIQCEENIMPESFIYSKFSGIDSVAVYESGDIAIGKRVYGKGSIYSFGFNIGYAYTKQTMKVISEGIKDFYPIHMIKKNPVYDILRRYKLPGYLREVDSRGIEIGDFGKTLVIVNHTPSPWKINIPGIKRKFFQYVCSDNVLQAHSAALINLRQVYQYVDIQN